MWIVLALQVLAQPPPVPIPAMSPSVTEWIILISVITTSIVTIINAIKGATGRQALSAKADVADTKLDVIHTLTNSKLTDALNRIAELEALIRAHEDHP